MSCYQWRALNVPCTIKVLLKTSFLDNLRTLVARCHVTIALSKEDMFDDIVRGQKSRTKSHLYKRKILTGQREHYLVQSKFLAKKSWHEIGRFCNDSFNAKPLTYSSRRELVEITNTIHQKLLFTAFRTAAKVRF